MTVTVAGERRDSKKLISPRTCGQGISWYPIGQLKPPAVPEMLGSAADDDDRRKAHLNPLAPLILISCLYPSDGAREAVLGKLVVAWNGHAQRFVSVHSPLEEGAQGKRHAVTAVGN